MTREELDELELADQAALRERRLILRQYADDLMATLLTLPKPTSYLDVGRALRAAEATDRTLSQLYSQPRRLTARRKAEPRPERKPEAKPEPKIESAPPPPKPAPGNIPALPARQAAAKPVKTSGGAKPDVAALMRDLRRGDTAIGRAYAGAPAWTNPKPPQSSP